MVAKGERCENRKKDLYVSSKLDPRAILWTMATNGGSMARKYLKVGLIPGMDGGSGHWMLFKLIKE
jgi:hypothetical protein